MLIIESLVRKLIGRAGLKSYCKEKLLVSSGSTSDVDKISTQNEYEKTLMGDMDLDLKNCRIR